MKNSLIPKNKIQGLRFGQLIYNAIFSKYGQCSIEGKMFQIENEELEKIINNYLKNYGK